MVNTWCPTPHPSLVGQLKTQDPTGPKSAQAIPSEIKASVNFRSGTERFGGSVGRSRSRNRLSGQDSTLTDSTGWWSRLSITRLSKLGVEYSQESTPTLGSLNLSAHAYECGIMNRRGGCGFLSPVLLIFLKTWTMKASWQYEEVICLITWCTEWKSWFDASVVQVSVLIF